MNTYKAIGSSILMLPRIKVKIDMDDISGLRKRGDIIIPEAAKLAPEKGESPFQEWRVVDAGPDCKQVKKKDIIVVNVNSVMRIPTDGEDLAYVQEGNVVAIVEHDKAPDKALD